ncbi:MAG: hypothetical protein AB8B69_13795 [Chitinophagales bacterium]
MMNNIQNEESVKPLTEEKQTDLKGGRKASAYKLNSTLGLSSPPRWKDE